MEIFGAWLFIIGLVFLPIIFIIDLILNIKYKNNFIIRNSILDIAMWCIFLCWICIIGGILLVYYF